MSNTLLVDGDNLLTIGFYGQKNRFYKGRHIGGLFHFVDTLRRSFETYRLDKICVFWDGKEWSQSRKKIYHHYKENRKQRNRTEEEINSYQYQRNRVKQYLEELYVRQAEFEYCESDDCIAFYTQTSPNEKKIVYSSDRDLVQLINDNVILYNPSHRRLYSKNEIMPYDHEEVLIENVKLVKILCGDPSDNIFSAYPGVRKKGTKSKIGLLEAFEDRNSRGYAWNNLMLSKWVDPEGVEHRVLDDYERNRLLVDLHAQPEAIVQELDQTIDNAKAENKQISQVGIRFMKFCAKYDLQKITEQAQLYVEPFNARLI